MSGILLTAASRLDLESACQGRRLASVNEYRAEA
jgi:hypothetical protein